MARKAITERISTRSSTILLIFVYDSQFTIQILVSIVSSSLPVMAAYTTLSDTVCLGSLRMQCSTALIVCTAIGNNVTDTVP
jgi:hypothetical protein